MNYIVCVMLESFLWINIGVVTCIVKWLTDTFQRRVLEYFYSIQRNVSSLLKISEVSNSENISFF